ncbi:hypothetical protein C8R44DRAFT_795209, partial [Mycena epipterygia]
CALRTIAVYLLRAAAALCTPPLSSVPHHPPSPCCAYTRAYTPAPRPRRRCSSSVSRAAVTSPRPTRDYVQTPPYLSSPSPCSSRRLRARVHSRAPTGVPRRTPETRCRP